MKRLFPLIIALCTCAAFFCLRDTKPANVWGRNVEPRLSSTLEWEPCRKKTTGRGNVVDDTQCGTAVIIPAFGTCDEISDTDSHQHVLRVLAFDPRCTDEAIRVLQRFARVDPQAMNDVAAAYYVRAQRNDAPEDFLHALDAVDQAIAAAPALPRAKFNRALILETLGLTELGIAAWDEFLRVADPPWDQEARERRRLLVQRADDVAGWQRRREALPAALAARDRSKVAQLIESFPSSAQSYFEEELLPQWAATPTQEQLERVSLLASELSSRMARDPFATDVAAAITRASQRWDTLDALQKGHDTFKEARRYERTLQFQKAADLFAASAHWFRQAGSPFRLRAELGHATALSLEPDGRPRALGLLLTIQDEVTRLNYRNLAARTHWMRAYVLDQVNYFESLAEYDATIREYTRMGDYDGLVAVYSRRAGVLGALGHAELAWRDAFYANRHSAHLVEIRNRHALLLEAAAAALALGHPRAAMHYHDAGVAMLQRQLVHTPPEDLQSVNRLLQLLSVAYAHRAYGQIALGQMDAASKDLDESIRLKTAARNPDPNTQRIQQAQADEVRGQSILNADPDRAIASFSSALQLTTFVAARVKLLTQRAEVKLRRNRGDEAEADLREALAVLSIEEQSILAERKAGKGEGLWSAYFARFLNTHHLLIRRLFEKNDRALAFAHAEYARAIEPLDLLRKRGYAPQLPPIPADEKTARANVAAIQASLPAGTFIIEYSVLDDRTYVWIISADRFAYLPMEGIGREVTDRWSTDLQRAIRARDLTAVDAILRAAYDGLVAAPLAAMAEMPRGAKPERLVFIPDGGIHGLPLAALRNGATGQFLIERAPVEIAGSAMLYQLSVERDQSMVSVQHPSILVVGNPAFDRYQVFARGMKPLKHAQIEAQHIYEDHLPYADILLGPQATVPAFLARAPNHEVVHIAAHALVNERTPSHSLLLFAPSPGRTGTIDAEQLLTALKLHRTRLVILSTCSSAGGLAVGPEGVAPLVRPLLAAGVPAVIGSLWEVNDATTEDLMVSFHRHYKKGSDAAVAMRKAQLGLLDNTNKDTALRAVLAWAPFQVIGHASSPFAPRAPSHGGTQIGIHSSNSLQRSDGLRPQ
jgi:CHAT domain-containing protein